MDRRTLRYLTATTVVVVALVCLTALLMSGDDGWLTQLRELGAALGGGATAAALWAVWRALPDRDGDGLPDVLDDDQPSGNPGWSDEERISREVDALAMRHDRTQRGGSRALERAGDAAEGGDET